MTEPINLTKARKARARSEATAGAARNRAFHGLTKAERAAAEAARTEAARRLDAHSLEP